MEREEEDEEEVEEVLLRLGSPPIGRPRLLLGRSGLLSMNGGGRSQRHLAGGDRLQQQQVHQEEAKEGGASGLILGRGSVKLVL